MHVCVGGLLRWGGGVGLGVGGGGSVCLFRAYILCRRGSEHHCFKSPHVCAHGLHAPPPLPQLNPLLNPPPSSQRQPHPPPSPIPLKVVASSLDSLRAEILQNFTSPHDLRECLKASANVPQLAGPPRLHRGHRLVDAAVFEPIPVKSAVRDGCTHVLALCSRPAGDEPAWGKAVRRTLAATVKRFMLSPVGGRGRGCLRVCLVVGCCQSVVRLMSIDGAGPQRAPLRSLNQHPQ